MEHTHHAAAVSQSQSWLDWFSQQDFMPHGHCYLWKPGLVSSHVISDFLIGTAYFAISLTLYHLVKKIKLPFSTVALSFGVFIGACGLTHFMEIWNLWNADYWTSAWIKVITAIASVTTGIYLYRLRHPIFLFAEAAKLSEQRRIDLEALTTDLGQRVEQRTSELAESEARFRQISEFMPQMVWTTDEKGNQLYFNQRWLDYTGLSAEESKGTGWIKLLHPEDIERTIAAWNHSLKTGETFNVEYRLRNMAGNYRWQLVRAAPLRNSRNEITQWFGTCTDIEDTKQVQIALKETVQARDNFLSIASHELNTPLTSLKLQAQLHEKIFRKDGFIKPERTEKFLSILNKQTDRLTSLINDMLDVSRVQSGKLSLDMEEADPVTMVKEIVDRFVIEGLSVKLQLSPTGKAMIDPLRFDQVVVNLLTNAMKYAPGSAIFVNVFEKDSNVRIEVKDQGPGIEKQNLERIFMRFERGISPNEVSGLGLGLFISSQIVEAHGGKIWAESEPGRGATFIIEIPVLKQD